MGSAFSTSRAIIVIIVLIPSSRAIIARAVASMKLEWGDCRGRSLALGCPRSLASLPPAVIFLQRRISITRRAVFHPGRCYFARLTSGKSRYVPARPRHERICT